MQFKLLILTINKSKLCWFKNLSNLYFPNKSALRHPAVIYAALVSMEDELMGEKSCAYLVVKEPLRAVQVRRFLREQGIAEFKLPDRVECVDSLPLTAVGKVDKKQLRQWLASRASA